MTCPTFDFHIHTKYLGCANETMEVAAIVRECERLGVTAIGITDHLNRPDQIDLHSSIREDLEKVDTDLDVWFGVELNFTGCDGGFVYSDEIRERIGFQFAIGGIHATYLKEYDLKKLVDVQHRHHLRTCEDPAVDVLVHPYWFGKGEFDRQEWPWFDSMKAVPESHARELGQVARDTGTAVEINADANLVNPAYGEQYVEEYFEYLAIIAAEGATFAVGSDAHRIERLATIESAWDMADRLGLDESRIWKPDREPMIGGKS
ncbi:MAG TPA: PHP domain-containing protein [Planctomycetota bacterium]|nr:PHP domain-containing protein [Planctomycetota bacterium]